MDTYYWPISAQFRATKCLAIPESRNQLMSKLSGVDIKASTAKINILNTAGYEACKVSILRLG